MTNWQVQIQAKWDAAAALLQGSYTQTITLTVAIGDGT